jgi:hypothetical protein
LKEWKVQGVIEKIGSCIRRPQSSDDRAAQYVMREDVEGV